MVDGMLSNEISAGRGLMCPEFLKQLGLGARRPDNSSPDTLYLSLLHANIDWSFVPKAPRQDLRVMDASEGNTTFQDFLLEPNKRPTAFSVQQRHLN